MLHLRRLRAPQLRDLPAIFNEKKSKSKVEVEERTETLRSSTSTQNFNSLLAAFANDTGPAADAIKELLKNPSREACEKLLSDLPSLLPDDPALAAVIAEEMAKQFGKPTDQANKSRGATASPVASGAEITQADAETIYEEVMSK